MITALICCMDMSASHQVGAWLNFFFQATEKSAESKFPTSFRSIYCNFSRLNLNETSFSRLHRNYKTCRIVRGMIRVRFFRLVIFRYTRLNPPYSSNRTGLLVLSDVTPPNAVIFDGVNFHSLTNRPFLPNDQIKALKFIDDQTIRGENR